MIARKRRAFSFFIFFLSLLIVLLCSNEQALPQSSVQRLPKEVARIPLPKLLEFGSNKCIPCKKMAPILQELTKEYESRVVIQIIEVYKEHGLTQANRIQRIPTQIFFDTKNREVYRHIGFMDKEQIKKVFEKMGVHPVRM
ncbi:MAG: thioredoxin [Deltaproteobacteria bacterium]|nr:thioredoxin [Deltaproteobacteria bacterium]